MGKPVETVDTVDKSAPSIFAALFPKTKWDVAADRLTPEAIEIKYDKISEEVDELEDALCDEGPRRALEEAVDVMVAVSGLVHRLAEQVGISPDTAVELVHTKNHERGYYPTPPRPLPVFWDEVDGWVNY